MSYETLKSQTVNAGEQVRSFLDDIGIDIDHTNKLPLEDRLRTFIEAIPGASDAYPRPSLAGYDSLPGRTSIVLLKPEIFPRENVILDALESKGYSHSDPKLIHPQSSQWFGIYGYMLGKHPDVIQNYIMQRSLGVKLVEINDMNEERIETLSNDVGKAYVTNPNTIRGATSRRIMKELGFLSMSGYASVFDPCGSIADNANPEYVFHCYNGIHAPSNTSESVSNIKVIM